MGSALQKACVIFRIDIMGGVFQGGGGSYHTSLWVGISIGRLVGFLSTVFII